MTAAPPDPGAATSGAHPRGPVDDVVTSLPVGLVAAAAAVGGVVLTGAAVPLLLGDPGPVVRWGLPVVLALGNMSGALTIGLLLLAATVLPVTRTGAGAARAFPPALQAAAVAASVWALAAVGQLVLGYADAAGTQVTDPDFGTQLVAFVAELDLGRALALVVTIAATVSLLAAGTRSLTATAWLLALSLVALVPPSLSGHSAGAGDHETAVTALGGHLLGVSCWVGGLGGLVLLWRRLPDVDRPVAAQRFSRLALWCYGLVAVSGAVNGILRLGGWSGLATRYGALLLLKVALLGVLGAFGWWHRRHTLPQLVAGRPRAFERFAGVETLILAVAVGLGAALARSAPPQPAIPPASPTLAQSLTGYPMPPAPTLARWFTLWQPDLLWLTVAALAVGWYLWAARTLRRRGDRWSVLRTLCWVLGWVVVLWSTSGAPAVYGRVSFSGHMVGHMVLSMVAPILLVAAAPLTLALRTTTARGDGSRGAREWLLALLESRYLRLLSRPVVAAVLFAGSLTAFYHSPLFELALRTHVGHELMHVHFLFAGFLFVSVLVGIDPLPYRAAPPIRLLVLFATMAFHAFFGVELLMGRTVLAAGYFESLGRTWGGSLLADQQAGGGFAWALGDLPTLVVAMMLAVQWSRSDDREAKRLDRAADRDGDADLFAYNEMLGQLAARDRQRNP